MAITRGYMVHGRGETHRHTIDMQFGPGKGV